MHTNSIQPQALATRSEVAGYLKKSPQTLAVWATQGKGPRFMKLENGNVRYRWSDVELWLNSQQCGGAVR